MADQPQIVNAAPVTLSLRQRAAAAAIGISPRMLRELTRQGRIPHIRIGTCVLYRVAELDRWLAEQVAKGDAK